MFGKKQAAVSEIYLELIRQAHLTAEHEEQLFKKRGLTKDTVSTLKIQSCGPYLEPVIEEIKKQYSLTSLLKAGIVYKNEKTVAHLLDPEKTLIPYLDETGKDIYYLKAHKQGNLPGVGIEPYCPFIVANKNGAAADVTRSYIVLCESEYKAMALWQLGFRAIGLNGVQSFSGENIFKLKPYIRPNGHAIILFDTEIQDDPTLPTYKSDQMKRYAHIIWAYKMAVRIRAHLGESVMQAGTPVLQQPNVTIATLPKHWLDDEGKIDCDSALAKGKGMDHFMMVLADALDPETYKDNLDISNEDRPWVHRKLEQEHRTHIFYKRGNKYYTKKMLKDNVVQEEKLSNFVVQHKNTIIKDGEVFREVYLKNDLYDISETFILSAKECSNYKDFKSRCLSRGDYMWYGSERMFNNVIEGLFLEHDSNPIHIIDHCGRNDVVQGWVFDNVILKDNGAVLMKDTSEDARTFHDKGASYRTLPLRSGGSIPSLNMDPIYIEEVWYHLNQAWGLEGIEGLAFVISTLFSNEVFKVTQAFPFLMLHGEREAGKSAMTDILAAIAGFPKEQSAQNIVDTTNVALGRIMNYYSSLPVRFDEFRNDDQKTQVKTSVLRSFYNRQGTSKGLRESFGIREVNVRACFILTGEEPPDDPALFSRVIPLHIRGLKNAVTSNSMKWLYENINKLSYITYYILKDYAENVKRFKNDFLSTIVGIKELMVNSPTYNPRAINHYAMMIAALTFVMTPEQLETYKSPLYNKLTSNTKRQEDESVVIRFFSDVFAMKHMNEPVTKYINQPMMEKRYGVIYTKAIYDLYAQYKQRHGGLKQLFSERTVKDYLKGKPYCLAASMLARVDGAGGAHVRCAVIDLTHPQCPSDLKGLFENFTGLTTGIFENYENEAIINSKLFEPDSEEDIFPE